MRTALALLANGIFVMWLSATALAGAPETYAQKCAGCHGKDGKADTSMGKKLAIKDLTDPKVQSAATDAQWEKIILEGYKGADGKMLMPATKVSADEAKELVKACRSLKK